MTDLEKQKKFTQKAIDFEWKIKQLGYVKVTRCKDCMYSEREVNEYGMPEIICGVHRLLTVDEGYCSNGAKK